MPATATPGAGALGAGAGAVAATGSGFPEDAIWSAVGKSLTGGGAGRYWLTAEHLVIDPSGHRNAAQQVPLAHVTDVEVTQTMTQKARGVSTVKVHVNHGGGPVVLSLDDLPEGRIARALISQTATRARTATPATGDTQTSDTDLQATATPTWDTPTSTTPTPTTPTSTIPTSATAPASVEAQAQTPAAAQTTEAAQPWAHAPSTTDPMQLLRMLGDLRDAGILTDEEFAAKKAQVLSRL
jgi:hypothetical protein